MIRVGGRGVARAITEGLVITRARARVIINTSVNVRASVRPGELRYIRKYRVARKSVLPVPLELVFNEPPSNWPRLFR